MMNEKKPTIEELINAYKSGKDADILKRIMLVLYVERDGMTRTGAAEHPYMARSRGRQVVRALPEGWPVGATDEAVVRQALACFQENHEEDMENPEEDHLPDGQGGAQPDQGDGRGGVPDPARTRPTAQPRLHLEGPHEQARPQGLQAEDSVVPAEDGETHPREEGRRVHQMRPG